MKFADDQLWCKSIASYFRSYGVVGREVSFTISKWMQDNWSTTGTYLESELKLIPSLDFKVLRDGNKVLITPEAKKLERQFTLELVKRNGKGSIHNRSID